MTTYLEALSKFDHPSQEIKDLLKHALQDSLIQFWPEVTIHEHTVARVASGLIEAIDILCTDDAGKLNGLIAVEALHAALDTYLIGVPEGVDIEAMAANGTRISRTIKERVATYNKAKEGDVLGVLTIDNIQIPITKIQAKADA